MRWTRQRQAQFFARTNDAATYGEVVWFWRSNAGAKVVKTLSRLTGDGGNQAMVTGKSTKETVKTIAQGRPDDPPVPVVLPRAFCCTRTMGAVGTRPSLRPLDCGAMKFLDKLGRVARREGGCMFGCHDKEREPRSNADCRGGPGLLRLRSQ